jgi:hypothetical protein
LLSQSQIDSLSGRIDRDVRAADPSKKKSGQIILAAGDGSQFQLVTNTYYPDKYRPNPPLNHQEGI